MAHPVSKPGWHAVMLIAVSLACLPKTREVIQGMWVYRQSARKIATNYDFDRCWGWLEENGIIAPTQEDATLYGVTPYGARFVSRGINENPGKGGLWAGQPVEFASNIHTGNRGINEWIVSLRIASKKSSGMKGVTQRTRVIRGTGLEEWSIPASSREPSSA